jgi:hypothetical protein
MNGDRIANVRLACGRQARYPRQWPTGPRTVPVHVNMTSAFRTDFHMAKAWILERWLFTLHVPARYTNKLTILLFWCGRVNGPNMTSFCQSRGTLSLLQFFFFFFFFFFCVRSIYWASCVLLRFLFRAAILTKGSPQQVTHVPPVWDLLLALA